MKMKKKMLAIDRPQEQSICLKNEWACAAFQASKTGSPSAPISDAAKETVP
jgi:hypothetical protein